MCVLSVSCRTLIFVSSSVKSFSLYDERHYRTGVKQNSHPSCFLLCDPPSLLFASGTFFLQDDECTGDIVGMTYNAGCAPVPTNGTYPGDYFTAECTESAAALDDDEEEEEEDVNDASGATLSHGFGCGPRGLVPGAVASASFAATAVAAVAAAVICSV